jgi:cadmium resistance protein CadD (predicted permease)
MEILLTSLLTFASTNIDDLFLLALFFSNRRFREGQIIGGQLLGIGGLIAASLAASLLGLLVPLPYIGLLGLFPVYLGIKALWNLYHEDAHTEAGPGKLTNRHHPILTVAGITAANGGDNIAIYTPLFTTLTWPHKLTMIGIFFLMTLVWCALAKYLARQPLVSKAVDRYGHRVTPLVLIALGLYILYESGSFGLLLSRR